MHWVQSSDSRSRAMRAVAALIIASIFITFLGIAPSVQASLTQASDTIDDSDRGVDTDHTIQFTLANAWDTGEVIRIQFDPAGDNFDLTNLLTTDIAISGGAINQVANLAACSGAADEVYAANVTEGPPDYFEIIACPLGNIAAATAVTVATANTRITNPDPGAGNSQSYVVRIGAPGPATAHEDSADVRVNIHDDVRVTATVATILNFTIAGLATTTDVNGTSTTVGAYAELIPFQELTVGQSEVGGQRLTVETNAVNGFSVTVEADQTLTSAIGAIIDAFANGATTSSPIGWVAPANTLGSVETYGHWGVTSEDSSLNGSDPFGAYLFAGNFINNPREIFWHDGPADGSTAHIGETDVGYAIQVESLQEPANDYQATLTYVVTPVF